ncbi:MAG: hypothetical protein JWQ25_1658, partial [Daejeonella sp.]|nr:hypothetical protein [Daejeonella sp.]
MNLVAGFHAYKFTHFVEKGIKQKVDPAKLSTAGKVKTLILGVD